MDNSEDIHQKTRVYWEKVTPNISGMLGGWTNVNTDDINESKKLLKKLLKPINRNENPVLRALDCGAGIGRVTKFVLSKYFDEIDLLEQNEKFLIKSKEYLADDYHKVKHTFAQGIQEFVPLKDTIYDCIWIQWVFGYLTDSEWIIFFQKCLNVLNKRHGFIVIKDNVTKNEQCSIDEEDGFVARPESGYLNIFKQVDNIAVQHVFKQEKMPKELFPVKMFVLMHCDNEQTHNKTV